MFNHFGGVLSWNECSSPTDINSKLAGRQWRCCSPEILQHCFWTHGCTIVSLFDAVLVDVWIVTENCVCADPAWSSHSSVCAQRCSGEKKQTVLRKLVCRSRVQLGCGVLSEVLLCGWRKRHIPLKWVSLGWKPLWELPRWPTTPSVFVQGEPWSWALCLPARILGSLAGVARQAHHSAPGCFAFGVKRAPSDEPAMS